MLSPIGNRTKQTENTYVKTGSDITGCSESELKISGQIGQAVYVC